MRNLLIIVGIVFHFQLFASHVSGGYITYNCLGNNKYYVEIVIISDCGGATLQPTLKLGINSNSCNYRSETTSFSLQSTEVLSTCGIKNKCNGGDFPGYKKGIYSGEITLPSQCADWELYTFISDRNVSIVNEGVAYFTAGINNANGNCFSSPKFTDSQIVLACVNNSMEYTFGLTIPSNINGVTSMLISPLTIGGGSVGSLGYPGINVTYSGGFSDTNPITMPGDFQYDGTNHKATFTTSLQGFSNYAAKFTFTDANGNYAGYTNREIQIISSTECGNNSPVFSETANTVILEVSPLQGEKCASVIVTDLAGDIISLVSSSNAIVSLTQISAIEGTAYRLSVCYSALEETCEDILIPVKVRFKDDGCVSDVFHERTFYVRIKKQQYCPEYQFITKRTPATTPVPPTVKAENGIYVGDDMPPFAPPMTEGHVVIEGNVRMVAGNVVSFSCADGTSGPTTSSCVDLLPDANGLAHIDIDIIPSHCNDECPNVIPEVYVKEIFECKHERLEVQVDGLNPPYLFQLSMNGQVTTYTHNVIDIHPIVSELDNGAVPYTVTVYDAVNNATVFSGSVLGTKRFYAPIVDSKIWIDYPVGSPLGEPSYYYAGNLGVYLTTPAYLTDSVHTTPPWYGATAMLLNVYNRWGQVIMRKDVHINNSEDWSIDQGEIYWNGRTGLDGNDGGNDPNGECMAGPTNMFNYKLTNRNCYNNNTHYEFDDDFDEQSSFGIFRCLDVPWYVVQTKSLVNSDYETQTTTGSSRVPDFNIVESTGDFISCYPSPMINELTIESSYIKLENLKIIDQTGKVVLSLGSVQSQQKINVKHLNAGIYILSVDTEFGIKRIKIVKN